MAVLNPISRAGSAGAPQDPPGGGEEEFGYWPLTIKPYGFVDITQETVDSWCIFGTDALQEDNGWYDVAVNALIELVGGNPYNWSWTCPGGTANVRSWEDLINLTTYMSIASLDVLVVNLIEIEGVSGLAVTDHRMGRVVIVKDSRDSTLVHEVGHLARLGDIEPLGRLSWRIMAQYTGAVRNMVEIHCPINVDEKVAFELGKQGSGIPE